MSNLAYQIPVHSHGVDDKFRNLTFTDGVFTVRLKLTADGYYVTTQIGGQPEEVVYEIEPYCPESAFSGFTEQVQAHLTTIQATADLEWYKDA